MPVLKHRLVSCHSFIFKGLIQRYFKGIKVQQLFLSKDSWLVPQIWQVKIWNWMCNVFRAPFTCLLLLIGEDRPPWSQVILCLNQRNVLKNPGLGSSSSNNGLRVLGRLSEATCSSKRLYTVQETPDTFRFFLTWVGC